MSVPQYDGVRRVIIDHFSYVPLVELKPDVKTCRCVGQVIGYILTKSFSTSGFSNLPSLVMAVQRKLYFDAGDTCVPFGVVSRGMDNNPNETSAGYLEGFPVSGMGESYLPRPIQVTLPGDSDSMYLKATDFLIQALEALDPDITLGGKSYFPWHDGVKRTLALIRFPDLNGACSPYAVTLDRSQTYGAHCHSAFNFQARAICKRNKALLARAANALMRDASGPFRS